MKTPFTYKIVQGLLAFAMFCLFSATAEAQRGYSKDSLQIKVYTEITYQRYRASEIKVRKVFCDYCSENQIKHLRSIAWEKAYNDRHSEENIMKEGKKRLAIYLRLPKEEFRKLRDEQRRRR